MLKLANLNYPQHDDYQLKRNRTALQIRKGNRDHIFEKTRNTRCHPFQKEQTTYKKPLIVDISLEAEIAGFLKIDFHGVELDLLIQQLKSEDILARHHGIIGLRKILAVPAEVADFPENKFIKVRLAQTLLSLAQQTEYPQLQLESAWALANLAACSSSLCSSIVQSNGVSILVNLLNCKIDGIIEQVTWALSNISSDHFRYRDQIIEKGAIGQLVEVTTMQVGKGNEGLEQCCWTLSNLCKGQPLPEFDLVEKALGLLCRMLAKGLIQNKQLFTTCCWTISYHCHGLIHREKPVMQSQLLDKLIPLIMQTTDLNLISACIRLVGNIAAGDVHCTRYLFHRKIVACMQHLLYNSSMLIRHEACWTLSNLAASDAEQVQQIHLNLELMNKLAEMLSEDGEDVRKEICYIFANLARADHQDQVQLDEQYLKLGIIETFVRMLRDNESRNTSAVLDCLIHIIRMSEARKGSKDVGFVVHYLQQDWIGQILQRLQLSDDTKVYQLTHCILEFCFEVNETSPLRL